MEGGEIVIKMSETKGGNSGGDGYGGVWGIRGGGE